MKKFYISISLLLFTLYTYAQGSNMNLTGDAKEINGEFFNIDLVNGANQTGGAWYPQSFNLDSTFYLDLFVDFGGSNAEGFAIVFHTDSIPGGIGGEQLGVPATGASFVTEFDLIQNTGTNDAFVPHASFFKNGGLDHQDFNDLLQNGTLTPTIGAGESLRVYWDPKAQLFQVQRQGCTNTLLNYTADIKNVIFGGASKVYVGFTAATSAASDRINILLNYNSRGISEDTVVCQGEDVNLRSYNSVPTDWSSDEPFVNGVAGYEIIAKPNKSAFYKVSTLDFCGVNEDSIWVEVYDSVFINLDVQLDEGSKSADLVVDVLQAQGSVSVSWVLPDLSVSTDQSLYGVSEGDYTVTVTDENLCQANLSKEINFDEVSQKDYITPNGDGYGDFILITVQGESKVVDSAGRVVNQVNYGQKWNGSDENGSPLPSGLYLILGDKGKQEITLLR